MVINFAEARERQIQTRLHKVKQARALEQAFKALAPYRATPEVAQVVLKLRAAARQLAQT